MKSIRNMCLSIACLLLFSALHAQSVKPGVIRVRKPKTVAITVAPEFPGGDAAMQTYIRNNTEYPETAKASGINGFVDVSFKIGAEGKISDVQISKGLGSGCDEAALKMVKGMPPWKPARLNQDPVAVQYLLHVPFPAK